MNNIKKTIGYAVIRYSIDGYTYIDTETISCISSESKRLADKIDKDCGPMWANANYQGKTIKVEIKVIE